MTTILTIVFFLICSSLQSNISPEYISLYPYSIQAAVLKGNIVYNAQSNGNTSSLVAMFTNGTVLWARNINVDVKSILIDDDLIYYGGCYSGPGVTVGYVETADRKSGGKSWSRSFGNQRRNCVYRLNNLNGQIYFTGEYGSQVFLGSIVSTSNALKIQSIADIPQSIGKSVAIYDNSLYIAGETYSAIPGTSLIGGKDMFLFKLDINGTFTDGRIYGSKYEDELFSVSYDYSNGNVFLVGSSYGTLNESSFVSNGQSSGFVMNIDFNGNLLSILQDRDENFVAQIYRDSLILSDTLFIVGTSISSNSGHLAFLKTIELNTLMVSDTLVLSDQLRGKLLSSYNNNIYVAGDIHSQPVSDGFYYYDGSSDENERDFACLFKYNQSLSPVKMGITATYQITTSSTLLDYVNTKGPFIPDPPQKNNVDGLVPSLAVVLSVFAFLFIVMFITLIVLSMKKDRTKTNTKQDGFLDSVPHSILNMSSMFSNKKDDRTDVSMPTVYKSIVQKPPPKKELTPEKLSHSHSEHDQVVPTTPIGALKKAMSKRDSSVSSFDVIHEQEINSIALKDFQGRPSETKLVNTNETARLRQQLETIDSSLTSLVNHNNGNMANKASPQNTKTTLPKKSSPQNSNITSKPTKEKTIEMIPETVTKKSSPQHPNITSKPSQEIFQEAATETLTKPKHYPMAPSNTLLAPMDGVEDLHNMIKSDTKYSSLQATDIKALRNMKIEQTATNLSNALSAEDTGVSSRQTALRSRSPTSITGLTPITVATLTFPVRLEMKPKDYAISKVLLEKPGAVFYVGEGVNDTLKKEGRLVVLKVYKESKSRMSREEWKIFQNEVSIMYHLQESPYFVKMLGFCCTPVALILKCYSKGSLDHWIALQKWKKSKHIIRSFAHDIAHGILLLHKAGIVHFDLKPSSVLIDTDYNGDLVACLGDFSAAQVAEEKSMTISTFYENYTKDISVPFTPPEQFGRLKGTAEQRIPFKEAKRVDVYSFGIVLYEMITRKFSWT